MAPSSEHGTPSNCGTPCRSYVPWQDMCPDSYGAAQLLGSCGALAGSVVSDLSLCCSLCTWLTWLLGHRSKDGGGLTSERGIPSNRGTPCRLNLLWQDICPDSYGAAQLLGSGGALVGSVTSNRSFWFSLPAWVTCLLGHRSKDLETTFSTEV